MMWIELKLPVRCTCGAELKAEMKDESKYENNLIEVEPCQSCIKAAIKKAEEYPIAKVEYSPDLIQRAIDHVLKASTRV